MTNKKKEDHSPPIPKHIQQELYKISDDFGVSLRSVVRKFNEVLDLDSQIDNIAADNEEDKYNYAVVKTREWYTKKNPNQPNRTTKTTVSEPVTLSNDEIKELKHPMLLCYLIEECQKDIIQEDDSIITLILQSVMNLIPEKYRHPTSDNLLVNSNSRSGKDYTIKKVKQVVKREECVLHRTRISEKTFTYWHSNDENWNWSNYDLHLEDVDDAILNCEIMKTMTSNFGGVATITEELSSKDFKITGKPTLTCSVYNLSIDDEIRNRFGIMGVDESEEQTKLVKERRAQIKNGTWNPVYDETLRRAVQNLPKVKGVTIPFAEELLDVLPGTLQMRSVIDNLFDYISASAVLHQFQREKNEKGEIVATWDDYFIARIAFMKTHGLGGISLSLHDKEVIEYLKDKKQATKHQMKLGRVATHYYLYQTHGPDRLAEINILDRVQVGDYTAYRLCEDIDSGVKTAFLPLFPKTDSKKAFYDEKTEKAILSLLEYHKDHKAVHKADFIGINSNGFMTFMYLFAKYEYIFEDKDSDKIENDDKIKKYFEIHCSSHKIIKLRKAAPNHRYFMSFMTISLKPDVKPKPVTNTSQCDDNVDIEF